MATITKPNTFGDGELIVAAQHNANFDTIYNDYNGNITNANIAANAAIASSKINLGNINTTAKSITQTAHGLAVKDVVRHNGTAYVKAKADAIATSYALGIVTNVTDANNFTLTMNGYTTAISGMVAGTLYYLSEATAGLLTSTEPSSTGEATKPCYFATAAAAGYVLENKPTEIAAGSNFVTGMIMMWSGTIATIPAGWQLCDGSGSSPDLRDKFVVCATSDDAGSAKTNITGSLTVSGGDTSHDHTGFTGYYSPPNATDPAGTPSISTQHRHTISSDDHIPPYYALAYIMKT